MSEKELPDWLSDKAKKIVGDAIDAEEMKLQSARSAGVEAARKRLGYHDPGEPRTGSEGEGDASVPPSDDLSDEVAAEPSLPDPEAEPSPTEAVPRARRSDPQTSHDAARSIPREDLGRTQLAILTMLHFSGPMTDPEIVDAYQTYAKREGFPQQSESGIRTRRSELVAAGRVVDSGGRRRLPSGRQAIIWKETPRDVDVLPARSADPTDEAQASSETDDVDAAVQDGST